MNNEIKSKEFETPNLGEGAEKGIKNGYWFVLTPEKQRYILEVTEKQHHN